MKRVWFSGVTPQGRGAHRADRGLILVLVMVMLMALMAMAMLATKRTMISAEAVSRTYHDDRTFFVADGGAQLAEHWLRDLLESNQAPTQAELDALTPPVLPGYIFEEFRIDSLGFRDDVLMMRGPLAGLTRDVQPYRISSRVREDRGNSESYVEVQVEQVATVLYQYAMYWDGDLELWPLESNPSVYQGHIHSNGDIYLGAGRANFDIIGSVTAAGHIYNTSPDPSMDSRGTARIADLGGQFHALSYDSRDPDWVTESLTDWDGLVQDSSHGVRAAPYPIRTLDDPIQIIMRGDSATDGPDERQLRFIYRAGLTVIDSDSVYSDSLGTRHTFPAGVVSRDTVYDWRERRDVVMHQFNLDTMRTLGLLPANGVIYLSYAESGHAVRLVNGQRLPNGGLVIATDNPVYVWGNFNSTNKQPCSIFCDSFNLYSVAWSDANANDGLNRRNANNTWLNACVVAGNHATDPGYYGGGASSLIRLHERWLSNDQLTYRGSLVCLWESRRATGQFQNASFEEHHRNSAFDPDLLDPKFWPDQSFWNSQVVRTSWRSFRWVGWDEVE